MALIRSELYDRAQRLIPGGVNSPVRAMHGVGLDEPLFMRSGDRPVHRGRQRQPLHRLGALVGAAALRARRSHHAGSRLRGTRARHDLRRADRGRSRPRRRDRRCGSFRRDGTARLVGHRGRDEHRAPRTRGDEARPLDQVLGPLPRPRRRAACERRLRPDDARDPVHPGRPVGRCRRHDRAPVQRHRCRRRRRRRVRRGSRRNPRRARRRQHGLSFRPPPGSSRRCGRCAMRAARCSSSTR